MHFYGARKLYTNTGGVDVTGGVNATGVVTATSFSGSGANLTNVDAATLDSVDSTSFLRSDAADQKTSGDLRFNNNIGITFGGSDNSRIFHDGTDLSLDLTAYVTDFKIRDGTTERYTFTKSGELSLVDINASGIITATQLNVGDNQYITAGVGTDVVIYHDGTNSYIDNSTGFLALRVAAGNLLAIQKAASAENMAIFNADGAVELYHNNNKRFDTTADGVDISGTGSIKVPVGTTAQRNSSPTAGDFRYNSDDGAFEGYTDSWGSIGGGIAEVDTNVSSTSAVGVGSFATASFRSAEVVAQIVQIDEYQVGKYLMIHDGTTVTVIEQAAVATGDSMLGSFDGAINGSNAELRVNMVTSGIATVTTKISTITI